MRQDSPHTPQPSVSAALAAASHPAGQDFIPHTLSSDPGTHGAVRFPGDDAGHSLADVAQRDLDAALQLLADRAQYITGAGGAAIALRRNGKNDLLCRASAGSNAPELGALLSTEYGLSGESVRTRRALRCDDAERDARVNREVCRELGIASVVVMPVVDDDQVLGVFELFSGKANAFGDRDMSALERLSQMVETAVRMARVAELLPERLSGAEVSTATVEAAVAETDEPIVEVVTEAPAPVAAPAAAVPAPVLASAANAVVMPAQTTTSAEASKPKPLFWSVALSGSGEATATQEDQSHVPPMMRNLRKCDACGFPVSAERKLCVECEEKKWRGQLNKPKTAVQTIPVSVSTQAAPVINTAAAAAMSLAPSAAEKTPLPAKPAGNGAPTTSESFASKEGASAAAAVIAPIVSVSTASEKSDASLSALKTPTPVPDFVLSAGLASQQSWMSRNKFLIAAIVITAVLVAAFLMLR